MRKSRPGLLCVGNTVTYICSAQQFNDTYPQQRFTVNWLINYPGKAPITLSLVHPVHFQGTTIVKTLKDFGIEIAVLNQQYSGQLRTRFEITLQKSRSLAYYDIRCNYNTTTLSVNTKNISYNGMLHSIAIPGYMRDN